MVLTGSFEFLEPVAGLVTFSVPFITVSALTTCALEKVFVVKLEMPVMASPCALPPEYEEWS